MFELTGDNTQNAVIKVVGVGGGGGNAVEHMLSEHIERVEFVCANTDEQTLRNSSATVIQLGKEITKGLGAGANPDVGRQAALEAKEEIKSQLEGADMVFITAGMGGGTGTGAAPVVAEIAKELGILTVAVVTKPFSFEGKQRTLVAEQGIKALSQHVDSLITIPNNRLLSVLGKNITLLNAFKAANNVLFGAVQGIADLITRPGLINVDFADVRTVMSEMGMAMMGTGIAVGENRAREAADSAIASPLLEDIDLSGAKGILVNVTAGLDMSIGEFEEVGDAIKGLVSDDAIVVVGTVIDPEMTEELRVTVIVTGLRDASSAIGGAAGSGAKGNQKGQPNKVRLVNATASAKESSIDYQQLDRPAIVRKVSTKKPVSAGNTAAMGHSKMSTGNAADVEYLDIPAFLRRQEETT